MSALRRVVAITRKEVRQLSRDRLTFGMIVGIPLLQIILFGYAINTDVRHLSAVADQAGPMHPESWWLRFKPDRWWSFNASADSVAQLTDMLGRGDIAVGVVIPPDFERRLDQPERRCAAAGGWQRPHHCGAAPA